MISGALKLIAANEITRVWERGKVKCSTKALKESKVILFEKYFKKNSNALN